MKKQFSVDDKVVLRNLGSNELEGATGYILGKTMGFAEVDFYLVMLDEPLPDAKAVVMIESCIYLQNG